MRKLYFNYGSTVDELTFLPTIQMTTDSGVHGYLVIVWLYWYVGIRWANEQ